MSDINEFQSGEYAHVPLRTTPKPHPDLIAAGQSDNSEVLFKMTRRHANILGAYLNGRNDIAPLPEPVKEILDALTLRLVSPPGARWSDLRSALDGMPFRMYQPGQYEQMTRQQFEQERMGRFPDGHNPLDQKYPPPRHRRPYDGGPNAEDLNPRLRRENYGVPLLGDADGTTMAEWPEKPETE